MSEQQATETAQRPWRAPFDSVRAEAIERIVSKLLGLACDGSETSCEDVLSGGVCPYDHAAQIVRDLSTPPGVPTSPTVATEGDGGSDE